MSIQQSITQPLSLTALLYTQSPGFKRAAEISQAKRTLSATSKEADTFYKEYIGKEAPEEVQKLFDENDSAVEAFSSTASDLLDRQTEAARKLYEINPNKRTREQYLKISAENIAGQESIEKWKGAGGYPDWLEPRDPEEQRAKADRSVKSKQDNKRETNARKEGITVGPGGLGAERAVGPGGLGAESAVYSAGVKPGGIIRPGGRGDIISPEGVKKDE